MRFFGRRSVDAWVPVPTTRIPEPELNGPASGRPVLVGHPQSSGPAPAIGQGEVIAFVQGYLRLVHPTYHLDLADEPDLDFLASAAYQVLMAEQQAILRAHWRREDDWFVGGGFQGGDGAYDVDRTSAWEAQSLGERVWQVTWTARLHPDDRLTHRGSLVGSFDDGLRLVDQLMPVHPG